MRDAVDACLTKAFRDVAVPEGLAERLLAGLTGNSCDSGADIPVCQEDGSPLGRQECLPHHSRRWLLTGGGLLAAAASIALAVWLGGQTGPCVTEDGAQTAAIQAFDDDFDQPAQLLANAPADYPFSASVWKFRGTSWRPLDAFLDRSGVVYELPGLAGTRARLYVVAAGSVYWADTLPKSQNPFNSAGFCASAWQEKGLLYVLVVQGDPSTYGRYLKLPPGPVA